jgi:hypothetical protein
MPLADPFVMHFHYRQTMPVVPVLCQLAGYLLVLVAVVEVLLLFVQNLLQSMQYHILRSILF